MKDIKWNAWKCSLIYLNMSLVSLDESVKNPSRCAASNTIPFRPVFHSTSAQLETTAFSRLKLFISFLWCRHLQVLFLVLLLFFSTRRKVSKNNKKNKKKQWRKLFGKCQRWLTFPRMLSEGNFCIFQPISEEIWRWVLNYDTSTFISVPAALCGCGLAVMPHRYIKFAQSRSFHAWTGKCTT